MNNSTSKNIVAASIVLEILTDGENQTAGIIKRGINFYEIKS